MPSTPTMPSTEVIRTGATVIVAVLYLLYALVYIGISGLLFSIAIGLIVFSLHVPPELSIATVILSGIVWKMFLSKLLREGFTNGAPMNEAPTGTGQNAKAIVKKVEEIKRKDVFQPTGVLSSNFVEGFESAVPTTNTTAPNAGSTGNAATTNIPVTATSTSAPVNTPSSTPMLNLALPSASDSSASNALASTLTQLASSAAANVTGAPSKPSNNESKPASTTTTGFTDGTTDGMFKLGQIPADVKGGAHIDVGTTLMNALNALKPDQIKQMTEDSRKLMETQKSLMGMLGTMKPMVQDGKQLIETFQEMFGNKI